jgi:hypothetical protein
MPCQGHRRAGTIIFAWAVRISKTYGADAVQVRVAEPLSCGARWHGLNGSTLLRLERGQPRREGDGRATALICAREQANAGVRRRLMRSTATSR